MIAFSLFLLFTLSSTVNGCTNLLVSKGASVDGSNIISYNADAGNFYSSIYHYPHAKHDSGAVRKTWSWDYGTYLGEIPEAAETYNVVGNVNEHGLVITESTFGGLSELACSRREGVIDYGSLIWITLQRTKTAREAIQQMADLVKNYGYASTGESFSIADQEEMWYMELIGKGRYEKGAVWVARRVPDGFVTGHANQARITTFPQSDPENCLYSADVIEFARKINLYSGDDASFSFSDTYDPVTFSGARFCEARVWSFFSSVMGQAWSDQYLDYAQGLNLTNRMPLWVQPQTKQSLADVMEHMRNHYEKTALDSSSDVGAGAHRAPYRWGSSTWSTSEHEGSQYFNERSISGNFDAWSIVCQSRPNVPREMAAIMWFGIDDSSTSVHFPVYGSVTKVSEGWVGKGPQDGATPPMMTFSLQSAFYVFNLVSNWAYTRWELMYPDVHAAILSKESKYFEMVTNSDAKALSLFSEGKADEAVEYLTGFSKDIGDALLQDWFAFFGQLFVKYRDGYVTTPAPAVPVCGCQTNSVAYNEEWYDRIIDETGDRYLVPAETKDGLTGSRTRAVIPKEKLRSFM